jgi:hypothetical protein
MRCTLLPHIDHPMPAVQSITVEMAFDEDQLTLRYSVTGQMEKLVFENAQDTGRADKLWQKSCFEIFIRPQGERRYDEYNFASTTHWAAYGFMDRRHGMHDLKIVHPPHIENSRSDSRFTLDVVMPDIRLPQTGVDIGLSVIVEDVDGAHSYWALAHPSGQADFHNDACFALRLPQLAFTE